MEDLFAVLNKVSHITGYRVGDLNQAKVYHRNVTGEDWYYVELLEHPLLVCLENGLVIIPANRWTMANGGLNDADTLTFWRKFSVTFIKPGEPLPVEN